MKRLRIVSMALAVAMIVTGLVSTVQAEPRRGGNWGRGGDYRHDRDAHFRGQDHSRDKNWRMDQRYNHNRFYPRKGYSVRELPRGYRVFPYRHERYFFMDGVWYRPGVNGFIVATPPVGLTLSLLPPYYTTIWANGIPYYYADDVYYRWQPQERVYVVSSPPPEKEVVEDASIARDLFIYPKNGQSAEQQDTDRYECHRWAVKQTGFDPTQPGGNVPADQNAAMRLDYQRAMKACLEARDYSVQ